MPPMPPNDHQAQEVPCVDCAIITVSDTRTPDTDTSGTLIRELLMKSGHRVIGYEIVPDEPSRVRERVAALCAGGACQAVILTGGTGLAPRDTTYEAVASLLEKRIDGFGELFRMLSFQEIGAAAMLSRAVAGVCRGTVVFSLPGSTAAVHLAMERFILPQLGHIVWLLKRS
jgi:molybdenum cofactor biosynthesis protein B